MLPLLKYVSLRHLIHRRGRTLLTLTGIVLGVAMIMSVFSLNGTITDAYTKLFSGLAGAADVEIAALSAAGIDEGILNDVLATAGVSAGVTAAAPIVKGNTIVFVPESRREDPATGTRGTSPTPGRTDATPAPARSDGAAIEASVFLLGVRPGDVEYTMRTYVLHDGRLLRPDDERMVLLTDSIASNLGVKPGDDVQLLTTMGKQTFTVAGLIGPGGPGIVNAGQLIVLPLQQAQRALGKVGRIDQIGLTLAPEADRAIVEQTLRAIVGDGAHVGRPTSGRAVEDVLGSLNLMLTFASGISLFAAFFLMYNNVSMAMAERRHEYGILVSLGLVRRTLLQSVIVEVLALSLIGGVLGASLGVSIANVMVHALGDTLAGALRLGVAGVTANPGATLAAIALGTVAALAAAFIPARQATDIAPTDVLRPALPVAPPRRRRLITYAATLLVTGTALIGVLLYYGTPANLDVFVWPLFGGMLVTFSGIIIALQPVVHTLPALFRRPLRALLGIPGYLAAGNLGRWPARTATTVGAMLVSLSMLVGVASLTQSYKAYLHRWVQMDTDWDLLVSSSWLGLGAETPLEERFRHEIEAIPGVQLASPERFVFLDYGDGRVYVSVFDMTEFSRFAAFNVAEGPASDDVIAALARRDSVAVSRPFAMVNDVRAGDTIELPTPGGKHPMSVAAVVDDMSLAGGTMYMDRQLYQELWQDDAVDAFAVKVSPGADPEVVRRAIFNAFADGMQPGADPEAGREAIPDALAVGVETGAFRRELPLTVQTSAEFAADLDQMVTESFSLIQSLVLVALIVAALGIANTLIMTVLERRRELAELRALGATQTHIRRIVLGEAIGSGLLGSTLGALIGIVIAWVMVEANRRFIGLAYPMVMPPSLVPMTAGIGLALAPVAGWIPARIAARMPIVAGMRVE